MVDETILIYMGQTAVCSGMFWLLYNGLLRLKIGYDISRAYLLFAGIVSGLIPLLRIPVFPGDTVTVTNVSSLLESSRHPEVPVAIEGASLSGILNWVYLLVAGVILIRVVSQFYRICRLRKVGTREQFPGFVLIRNKHITASFSFFDSVFVGNDCEEEEIRPIIMHEQSHIRHCHSIDRVLFEILVAVMWYNPFIYLLKRKLIEIHEYQADRDVLNAGVDMSDYRTLILQQVAGRRPEMVCNLNQSFIKKRFIMMTKFPGSKYALLRMMAVLPVLAVLMLLFSFTKKASVYVVEPQQEANILVTTQQKSVDDRPAAKGKSVKKNISGDVVVVERSAPESKGSAQSSVVTVSRVETSDMSKMQTVVVSKRSDTAEDSVGTYSFHSLDGKTKPVTETVTISRSTSDAVQGSNVQTVKVTTDSDTSRRATFYVTGTKEPKYVTVTKEPKKVTINGKTEISLPDSSSSCTIQIRSKGSSDSVMNPLILIDGKEMTKDDLASIKSDQIESFSVLKDDAAIAVYGESGANGVCVITTKKKKK